MAFTVFNSRQRLAAAPRMREFSRARFAGVSTGAGLGYEPIRGYFFGPIEYTLAASVVGVAFATATLSAGGWQKTPLGWSNASGGTDRQVVTLVPTFDNPVVKLNLANPTGLVHILLRTSEDGRDAYEIGVYDVGPGVYWAQIRKVTDGTVAAAAVTNGSGDLPASAACESNVSALVTAGNPFTIEARLIGSAIEFRLNNETDARLRHTADSWADNNAVGFASAVNSARVIDAQVCDLVGQRSVAQDILTAVCGGDYWTSRDTAMVRVSTGYFPSTGIVQMEPFNGKMLVLGPLTNGLALAAKFDPVTLRLSAWTPTSGTLPGQVGGGTTTGQVLVVAGTRAGLAAPYGDEQNMQLSAVGDEDNQITASELPGTAFTLAGVRPLKLGHPIVCVKQATNSVLIIGCNNSIQAMLGDPALGAFDTGILSEYNGISGPQSMVLVEEGRVIGHGENGLYAIPPVGTVINISQNVLQEGLNLTREELALHTIVLARDPERGWLHIFKTPLDGSNGVHLIYAESVGGFVPGRPAYFGQQYPASMQPTCATVWKGRLYIGCADGYIRYFDDTAFDDDGAAIDAKVPGELLDSQDLGDDMCVRNIRLQMTKASGSLRVKVYGAEAAVEVYDEEERTVLLNETVGSRARTPIPFECRAPAVIIELSNAVIGESFVLEGLSADLVGGATRTGV